MGDGETFVNNSSPNPLQKTLTGKWDNLLFNPCSSIKFLSTRHEQRAPQSKFFERVWENTSPLIPLNKGDKGDVFPQLPFPEI